jgi:hypothetical protein
VRSPPFTFPPSKRKPLGICFAVARTCAPIASARGIGSKFLLRQGRRFTATKKAWTKRHAAWLQAQRWPLPALEQTHRAYLRAVDEAVGRLQAVDRELRDLLTIEPLRARVERLRCFRGIDDLTALTIAAELGTPISGASWSRPHGTIAIIRFADVRSRSGNGARRSRSSTRRGRRSTASTAGIVAWPRAANRNSTSSPPSRAS